MCLKSESIDGGKNVKVEIPPTRAGILFSKVVTWKEKVDNSFG